MELTYESPYVDAKDQRLATPEHHGFYGAEELLEKRNPGRTLFP